MLHVAHACMHISPHLSRKVRACACLCVSIGKGPKSQGCLAWTRAPLDRNCTTVSVCCITWIALEYAATNSRKQATGHQSPCCLPATLQTGVTSSCNQCMADQQSGPHAKQLYESTHRAGPDEHRYAERDPRREADVTEEHALAQLQV